MSEDHKLLLKRIGLVGFSQTYHNMKGLVLLPILTSLGSTQYGVYSLILISVTILQPFILLGLQDAVLRFLSPQSKEKICQGVITVAIVILLSGTIAAILFFLLSDSLANIILKDPSAASIIKIAAPFILLDSMNTYILSTFRVFGMIKKYAAILIIKTTLEMGLIYFFVLSGFGLFGAIISLMISSIISITIMLYLIFSYAGFSKPNFLLIKPYLLFGLPLIPILSSLYICDINDRYVIGFYLGAGSVGIYSAAYGIGTIPSALARYVLFVLGPTVYNLYDNGKVDKVKFYLSYAWKYLAMLLIPCAFGLSILGKPLLQVMTSSEFVTSGTYIIPFVAFGILFWGMEGVFAISLYIFKRRKIFVIAFICGAGTNFVLNIILVPMYGLIAAAITTAIAYFLITIIIGYSSRRYFQFDLNFRFISKSFVAASVMTLVIWIFGPTNIVEILISIIIGIIIYFCLLISLRGFTREELGTIFEIFRLKKFYEKIVITYDHFKK
jgi:O-antigen/teichoic acid export membrane protein